MHRTALGPLQDLDSILSGWWTTALKTQVSPTGDQRVKSQRTLGKHWKIHLSLYRTVTLHLSLFVSAQSILYLASFLPGRKPFLRFATICHRRMCRGSLFPIVLGLVGPVGRKNSVSRFQNQYGACYCLSGGYGCVTLLFDVHVICYMSSLTVALEQHKDLKPVWRWMTIVLIAINCDVSCVLWCLTVINTEYTDMKLHRPCRIEQHLHFLV